MGCEFEWSYSCTSGYDAETGDCCDLEKAKMNYVVVFFIVLFSILCVACCCAVSSKRRADRDAVNHALYRNKSDTEHSPQVSNEPPTAGYYAPVPTHHQAAPMPPQQPTFAPQPPQYAPQSYYPV